jgi:hypothetical protein
MSFTKSMNTFEINSFNDALELSIDGPLSSYDFSFTSEFVSSKEMKLYLELESQIIGYDEETLTIKFTQGYFTSTEGVTLANNKVESYIYQMQVSQEALKGAGTAITSILGFTIGVMILSNVIL